MDVRLPDGTIIQNVPDGTTKADLVAKLKSNGMAVPAEWLDAPAAPAKSGVQQVGDAIREVPRQIGLTARYAMEGLPAAVDTLATPFRAATDFIAGQVQRPTMSDLVAGKQPVRAATLSTMGQRAADWLGLPKPQNELERVVGDATRMGFGSMGMAGGANAAANVTTGTAQNVLRALAANPGTQVAGGAGAGAASGAVRESGGGPLEQGIAAFGGGMLGGYAANTSADAARRLGALLTPQRVQLQNADAQIQMVLQRSGIDWSQVPERVRQGMRSEVAAALQTGQPLNPEAINRLRVFQTTGTTPTVGMLTQNPGQITRERNLAKVGANSTDASLQRLPAIQNDNAAQLLRNLDQAGAAGAPDAFNAGTRAVGALRSQEAAARGEINSLYSAARDTGGRSLPLEGGTFTARANQLLDEANVGSFLPPDIASKMNAIALGKYPLTVDVAEQLKSSIGNLQRGTADGNARRALGLVRQALDEAPLQAAPKVNPGNLPAVPGTVPPSPAVAGQESIDAFNRARGANRAWMQRVEGNPALQAVVDGIEPDQFMQRFVLGRGASAADVRGLAGELDPGTMQALKQYLVRHLRDAATNSTDDITKFSNDAYRRALRDIGDQKLGVFFSPEELQHLKDVGDAAKYMQAQPMGSAVNNSNSGALVLGRGLDMLAGITGKLPLGLKDTISGTVQGIQQRQVLAPRNALVQLAQPQAGTRVNPLLAAALVSPAVQARQNDGR
jgi:hypothetical protein